MSNKKRYVETAREKAYSNSVHDFGRSNHIRSMSLNLTTDDTDWVCMPNDVKSTIEMTWRCLRNGNKRTPQYMFNSALNKRCLFQTTLMLMGESGKGKSSVVNHLMNSTLVAANDKHSETRSVTEYYGITAIKEIRTRGVRLGIVDTPGFIDTDGLRQDACNLMAIRRYCAQSCCMKRSCFPNVILLCVSVNDNRFDGPNCSFARSLKVLKDLQVIDPKCPNLIVVMTHACSFGFHKVHRWMDKLAQKAKDFQEVIKEYIGFEPSVVYLENSPEDYDLDVVNGGTVLPDGRVQPLNLFESIMELMQKNKDELGYVTIREFYRRSSVGVNFMIDSERTVAGKIAKNSDLTDEEEKCVKYLQEKREDFEMICDTIVRENELLTQNAERDMKVIEECLPSLEIEESQKTECGRSRFYTRMVSSSLPDEGAVEGDQRKADAESKALPPEDKHLSFKTIIAFILAGVGLVGLFAVGAVGSVILGPLGVLPIASVCSIGSVFTAAFAKKHSQASGSSSKNKHATNDREKLISEKTKRSDTNV